MDAKHLWKVVMVVLAFLAGWQLCDLAVQKASPRWSEPSDGAHGAPEDRSFTAVVVGEVADADAPPVGGEAARALASSFSTLPPPKHDAPVAGDGSPRPAGTRPAEGAAPKAPSRILPVPGASAEAWAAAIDRWRAARNPVALQHLIEELPIPGAEGGLRADERYRLLARGALALASLGEEGRPALEDLRGSGDRFVRLAAMNAAFAVADAAERERMIAKALADPDPVIVAKGRALAGTRR